MALRGGQSFVFGLCRGLFPSSLELSTSLITAEDFFLGSKKFLSNAAPFESLKSGNAEKPAKKPGKKGRAPTTHISTRDRKQAVQKAVDRFLQEIERPKVLDDFPDFEKIGEVSEAYRIPTQDMFAVVQLGAHQFKVTTDDLIFTEKVRDVNVAELVKLGRVLMLGSKTETVIGRPFIAGAYVKAAVEEQCQDAKVISFKKIRRKNHRRTRGHRQELTGLRILEICGEGKYEIVAPNPLPPPNEPEEVEPLKEASG